MAPGNPEFMRLALRLARRGLDRVSPNPPVGAVVSRGAQILGQGWHRRLGGPHAEVEALADARKNGHATRGADLHVTLEPCGHRGRTPPCAEAIVEAGIRRVHFAVADPNPQTRGKGPRRLRRAGIVVHAGLLEEEGRDLLAPYLHFHATGRPWVLSKWAMSADGKIATCSGDSRWITGERARAFVHRLRRRVDAVLVGTETYRLDDPSLLPRPARGRFPLRVILDRRGRLSQELQVFSDDRGPRLYVTGPGVPRRRLDWARERGLEILQPGLLEGRLDLEAVLEALGERGVTRLLVEGGARIHGELLDRGLVDEVAVFVAPGIIGGTRAPGPVGGNGIERMAEWRLPADSTWRRIGPDMLLEGRLRES